MDQHLDLKDWLSDWPYDDVHNVRIARGADGREIMHVRTPLGIEQYELEGRPDGQRPYGAESVFDHHLARLAAQKEAGKEDTFRLSRDECAELFDEGVLFYHRYLHLFQLEDWKRTARDTARNLLLFDFVNRYAKRQEDRLQLEQWRPYILRMNAAAEAMVCSEAKDYEAARRIIRQGISRIESLPEMDNPTFVFERKRSLEALQGLAAEIEKKRPLSKLEELNRELHQAVSAQEFERAAELRDQIRALRNQSV
jgi:hypothetical protein